MPADKSTSRSHREETGKNKNAAGSDTGGGAAPKKGSESQRARQLGQSSDKSNRRES